MNESKVYKRRILILGILIISIFLFANYLLLDSVENSYKPTFRKIEIKYKNTKIFIKSKNWGVTDDNQITVISSEDDENFNIDKNKHFIFNGLTPFFYKQKNDTLFLFVRTKGHVPKNFKSNWKVIQTEVNNATMMNLYNDKTYKHY